jgi:hypothetical protein
MASPEGVVRVSADAGRTLKNHALAAGRTRPIVMCK